MNYCLLIGLGANFGFTSWVIGKVESNSELRDETTSLGFRIGGVFESNGRVEETKFNGVELMDSGLGFRGGGVDFKRAGFGGEIGTGVFASKLETLAL